jgi:hypothetical protein
MVSSYLRFRMRTLVATIGILAVVFAGVWETGRIRERMRRARAARVLAAIQAASAIDFHARREPPGPGKVCRLLGDGLEVRRSDDLVGAISWRATSGSNQLLRGAMFNEFRMGVWSRYVLTVYVRPEAAPRPSEARAALGSGKYCDLYDNEFTSKVTYKEEWGSMVLRFSRPIADRESVLTQVSLLFKGASDLGRAQNLQLSGQDVARNTDRP